MIDRYYVFNTHVFGNLFLKSGSKATAIRKSDGMTVCEDILLTCLLLIESDIGSPKRCKNGFSSVATVRPKKDSGPCQSFFPSQSQQSLRYLVL